MNESEKHKTLKYNSIRTIPDTTPSLPNRCFSPNSLSPLYRASAHRRQDHNGLGISSQRKAQSVCMRCPVRTDKKLPTASLFHRMADNRPANFYTLFIYRLPTEQLKNNCHTCKYKKKALPLHPKSVIGQNK